MKACAFGLTLLMAVAPETAGSQAPRDSLAAVDAFVAAVRQATARYRDQSAAVADGYRKIGPDFPGMGEHWISVPLLLDGSVDPQRPPILEYARLNGELTLVGAAFAVLLSAHEQPPAVDGLPVDASAWHYHGGTVSEESFVAGHAHGAEVNHHKPRVAVLHVWTGLDNPAGPFATDNWALPFARLGLPAPVVAPSAEVAHGLALAAGGEPYYLRVIAMRDTSHVVTPDVQEQLERAAVEIREVLKQEPLEQALVRVGEIWVALGVMPGVP